MKFWRDRDAISNDLGNTTVPAPSMSSAMIAAPQEQLAVLSLKVHTNSIWPIHNNQYWKFTTVKWLRFKPKSTQYLKRAVTGCWESHWCWCGMRSHFHPRVWALIVSPRQWPSCDVWWNNASVSCTVAPILVSSIPAPVCVVLITSPCGLPPSILGSSHGLRTYS